jgi:dihydroneopterin aldolase
MAEPIPFSPPAPGKDEVRLTSASVFVRGIQVEAEIGIYAHEYGRTQPLVIDVEITVAAEGFETIADTINYETITDAAREIAASGHLKLVETFAERLARACLEDPRARRVRVRVEKPQALAPHAEAAGVELVLEKS